MSKVRLYHLARNWDVPSSMIIETLAEKGRRLKSHFVEVDTAEVPEIKQILQEAGLFGRPKAPEAPVRVEPAPEVERSVPPPAPVAAEPAPPERIAVETRPVEVVAPARDGDGAAAVAAKPAPLAPEPAPAQVAPAAPAAPAKPAATPSAPARPAAAAQRQTFSSGVAGAPRMGAPGPGPGVGPRAPAPPAGRPGEGRPPSRSGPYPAQPARPGEGPRPQTAARGPEGAAARGGGPIVPAADTEFRPGRIVSRAPRPEPGSGPPPSRFGPPGARPGPGGPGARPGPGGPPRPGGFGPRPVMRGADYAMPEIRARTDIPVTPNLRGDEESRRRSRFGPGAPQGRGAPGRGGEPGGEPGEGTGSSRTAISPAKKGKQATRRSGPGGSTGAGRRMERRMHERDRWKRASTKRKRTIKAGPINRPTECTIELPISVKDLSAKFAVRIADIMKILMEPPHNLMLNMNAPIPAEAITALAAHFNIAVEITDEVDVDDETVKELEGEGEPEDAASLAPRQPVVTVLGHVDHGKTSLLDKLRQAKAPVAEQEAGGITQHIGAYVAEHAGKPITFLDTPGHQAFTAMRARGANVTDIVLLVVAADDGVMPQTREAIAHAKAADISDDAIVVALNKMDKPSANPEKVKGQLASEGLQPVEWGGHIEVVPVSAATGDGIDKLMETLLIKAELLELKANPEKPAKGTVLEAKKTEGRGVVATVLVEDGTLRRGDLILCGPGYGKVRMLFSDRGKPVKEAGPGVPVEVIGLSEVPSPGDRIYVMEDEKKAREIIEQRENERRLETATKRTGVSAENIWEQLGKAEVNEVRLILKTDVTGSLEVLKAEIEKLSGLSTEVRIRLLHADVGTITTSDVILAEASKPCFVIGFTVSPEGEAAALAREKGIEIRTYKVIYELLDDLQKIMSGEIAPEEKEVLLGTVLVRQTFKSSKVGTIAGSVVEKGSVKRSGKARLMRDGVVIWEGDIEGLRRFKDDVKEVKEGFECGIRLRGYDDVKEGDKIEVYEVQKVARSL